MMLEEWQVDDAWKLGAMENSKETAAGVSSCVVSGDWQQRWGL